ncbi:MAG: DNA repair protein RadC [Acetobacteraceae bacterium]|nr:DNA repair protein RadC [Acetobacteraceae bacterium]
MKDLPPEERPRERLLSQGASALSNAELLAIVIRTGSSRETALELARRVLVEGARRSGGRGSPAAGLRYLLDATVQELSGLNGMGPAKVAQIKAALELGRRLASPGVRPTVKSPRDVADLVMERMRYLDREHFQVVLLNTRNQVLGVELVSVGTLSSSVVHPREVFKAALRRSAAAIILVHNHPSGDPTPSPEDVGLTRRLSQGGHLLGVEVLDHVVIGDGCFVSLREREGF